MKELKKVVALVVAVLTMAAMSLTAFAAGTYTQEKYFYTDAAATQASYMGHGCIAKYVVGEDGKVTLYLQEEEYERGGVTYVGNISSLTINGKSASGLVDGSVFEFIPTGEVSPVSFTITMVNVDDENATPIQHPAISGYLKLEHLQ